MRWLSIFMYFCLWGPLWLARKLWWNWTIEGLENLPPLGQGVVIVVNHHNWTDIHVTGASLPFSYRPWWIAKIEVFKHPAAAWFFNNMRVIPIKRGKRDLSALIAGENALKQGYALIVFPEGHRSRTGGLIEGHGGAIRLAVRTGCPILPIAVWGTEHGFKGAIRRKPIHLRIGRQYHPAVNGQSIPADRMEELTEEMMLRIAELLPEQYWGFYRERMLQTHPNP